MLWHDLLDKCTTTNIHLYTFKKWCFQSKPFCCFQSNQNRWPQQINQKTMSMFDWCLGARLIRWNLGTLKWDCSHSLLCVCVCLLGCDPSKAVWVCQLQGLAIADSRFHVMVWVVASGGWPCEDDLLSSCLWEFGCLGLELAKWNQNWVWMKGQKWKPISYIYSPRCDSTKF